jgi:predicted nucleic acid-binding protein
MNKRIKRIYVDSSVVLGVFDKDETRRKETAIFWDAVKSGEIIVVLSNVLLDELKYPSQIWTFLDSLPESNVKHVVSTEKSNALARQYIDCDVISIKHLNDCFHVALATFEADGIASWNLSDMVKRMDKYNSVNTAKKCRTIKIVTPNRYKEICHEPKND